MNIKRQFIAGASCPECQQQDKIQRVIDGDTMWIECVSCGMRKDLDAAPVGNTAAAALATAITLKPASGKKSSPPDDQK